MLTRYCTINNATGDPPQRMRDPSGDYVLHADAQAEIDALRERVRELEEEKQVLQNVLRSDESQIKNLVKRLGEMREDCIRTAEARDELKTALKRETNEYIGAAHGFVIEIDRLKAELAEAREATEAAITYIKAGSNFSTQEDCLNYLKAALAGEEKP